MHQDLEPQGENLIEEDFHVVDDGHKRADWTIINLLRPINRDPNSYWREETWGAQAGPMLGTNLYLTYLLPPSVNPLTLQAVYAGTTMTEIKHYSRKKRELISHKKKMKEGTSENQGTKDRNNMVGGQNWEEVGDVKEIMEALMNLAALEFSIDPTPSRPW